MLKETMNIKIVDSINKRKLKTFTIHEGNEYSYEQLNYTISSFVDIYRHMEHGKVLICARQGFYEYAAILAAYLTGCTFCIVNAEFPVHRKEYINSNFCPDLILCYEDDDYFSKCGNSYCFGNIENGNNKDTYHLKMLFQNEIAYVAYTSGSTGLPKGCMIKRTGFEVFCKSAIQLLGLCEQDVLGQYVPLHFDMSLIDIFGGVIVGATLVVFGDDKYKLRPGKYISKYKVTYLNVVPQFLEILIRNNQLENEYINTLRMIRFGGDKVSIYNLEKLFAVHKDIIVASTYGATETTCFCFAILLNRSNYKKYCHEYASIGNVLPGWHAYLKNVEDDIGELVIYGDNIGAGYIHENNEKQSLYNYEEINGQLEHVYYTGDYARKEGDIFYFVGRKDYQAKINSNRISLGEIEYDLMMLGLMEPVALVIENKICAFYIQSNKIDKLQIMNKLKQYLPSYALPNIMIELSKIPYNLNGKIDRLELKRIAKEKMNL